MKGTRLSHYRIADPIGAGGMGVVHRARDEHLERDVAVKVLGKGLLADDAMRRRFRREALALSRLNHPNIATIFDFDTQDDVDFLVMELIPGETLDAVIARGRVDPDTWRSIAVQAAEGLTVAHESGVIHRDLKPGNLRVTPDGRLKILDFGLARHLYAAPDGATATATEYGAAVGTLAYMAPETLDGRSGDERSDLYALGVLLYELATGRRPFEADTILALMYAIANHVPRPPALLNPDVPAFADRIVMRLIERDPADRFPSARELLRELRAGAESSSPSHAGAPDRSRRSEAGAGGSAPPSPRAGAIRTLAVLPLENLSGDPGQEFFADGMTDALISDLARIKALRVISRSSVMRFKGVRRPLREIAAELGVEGILEGTVIRSGDRVRVTAQLSDAGSENLLWSERYERDMTDILMLQSDVAAAVAQEIEGALSGPRDPRTTARRMDPEAYDAVLRGRHQMSLRNADGLRRAVDHFQAAIGRDPAYAPAYVGLAEAYGLLGFQNIMRPEASFTRARAAAQRALELDPTAGEAYAALGYARLYYDWDWAQAERDFLAAIESRPSYGTGYLWYTNLLVVTGRFEEAIANGRKSRELDPLSVIPNIVTGWAHFFRRDYDEAVRELKRPFEITPDFAYSHQWLGWTWMVTGRRDEASRAMGRAARQLDHEPLRRFLSGMEAALGGRSDDARGILEELRETARHEFVPAFLVALLHLALDDTDGAFSALETAFREREHWLAFLDVDPRLDSLRSDSRFADLRKRVGLP